MKTMDEFGTIGQRAQSQAAARGIPEDHASPRVLPSLSPGLPIQRERRRESAGLSRWTWICAVPADNVGDLKAMHGGVGDRAPQARCAPQEWPVSMSQINTGSNLMRHRHALYLSEAMTQRLQLVAEAHRLSKSEILERALRRYLTSENNDTSLDLINIQQEANARSLRRLERDLAIAVELTATFVRYFVMITPPLSGGRARGGAGTRPAPVRTGDRERSKPSQDGPRIGCAGDGDGGPEPPQRAPCRQPAAR